jgi:hypothetical protein
MAEPNTRVVRTCSQCHGNQGLPVAEEDLVALADPDQVGEGAGLYAGGVGTAASIMGLSLVKRVLLRRFSRYAFCADCRIQPGDHPRRCRLVKALAALAFFAGFILVGIPVAIVLYAIGALVLRAEVARFAAAPRASSLPPLLEAYAVFVTSAVALGAVLVIFFGVVIYSEFS